MLMTEVFRGTNVQLVVDDEHLIETQYDAHLRKTPIGKYWLIHVRSAGKFIRVPRRFLDRSIRKRLAECHFDREDLRNYVRTAASSPSKTIVTHDGDYSGRVVLVLKRHVDHDMRIETAEEAHGDFCPSPIEECLEAMGNGVPWVTGT